MAGRGKSATSDASNRLLSAALGSMPYGFSIWDLDFRLLLFNQQYLDLYGFTVDQVRVGMPLAELCETTVAAGNHPGVAAAELYETYQRRLEACSLPDTPLRVQKAIRGRFIKTTHVLSPGLGWIVTHEDVTEVVEQQWLGELREKALADQNLRFDAALRHMPHGISLIDAEKRLVICNERYREMYELPEHLCRPGTPLDQIVAYRHAQGIVSIDKADEIVMRVLEETSHNRRRVEAYRMPDGRVISLTQSTVGNGGFVTTHEDVTLQLERFSAIVDSEREMKLQNLRFEAAIDNMSQGLCMFDKDERLVVCNVPYAELYKLPPELTVPGTTLTEILDYRFSHGMAPRQNAQSYRDRTRAVRTRGVNTRDEIELEDGRTIAVGHRPIEDGGWVATHEDITELRRIEERIRHLARHDALTDLPNRVLMREKMAAMEALIERGDTVAVLCLDLDHFKAVNDTLGHGIGDTVLINVANKLRNCCRDNDVVARLGGDEFAILALRPTGPDGAAALADRIVRTVSEPMEIEGHQIVIGTSVGIALAPSDGRDAESLLRNADLALYRAKSDGRGAYHFFEPGMDEAVQNRRDLEQGLRLALVRSEFQLAYQPLLNLADNQICGFEALLRWQHPDRGLIAPADFIPVAEETGMINAIGKWVLEEACRTATEWPDPIRIAVNLSAVQFKSRALVDHVEAALAASGLDPGRLELEVTETLLLANTDLTLSTLHRLRALGVRISMDDFGTGYSSLSYLRSFPFDKIKIDRSFVSGLGPDSDAAAIIKAVVGLSQSLGMSTTAEGVETEEQLTALRAQGCNEVQGFLFSPPLPASGARALLGRRLPDTERNRQHG